MTKDKELSLLYAHIIEISVQVDEGIFLVFFVNISNRIVPFQITSKVNILMCNM